MSLMFTFFSHWHDNQLNLALVKVII